MTAARILLVEDETDVMQANATYLEDKGFEVLCANSLREARLLQWEAPAHLIVLDVTLPDGSGYDFCQEIRQTSLVPVIFLTCMGEDQHIVAGLGTGGDDYVVKPYSLAVLYARIVAQLRRNGAAGGEILLPPLTLNLTAGVATLEGREVPLTRKEFQLLVYLVEHRGQDLPQAQIYEAVWNEPVAFMGNTLRVHISHLRQKLHLDDGSAFELSHTAGQGYMFLRTVYAAQD